MHKRQKVSGSAPATALPATVTAGHAVPRQTASTQQQTAQKKSPTLIKQLANPENQEQRERAFHLLRRWLTSTGHPVTQLDQHKIWRGLYYMFWHSDGYKQQQTEAAELASMINLFGTDDASEQRCCDYLYAYCKCMQREWQLIDGLRMDKFMSLVRRMMYDTLLRMKQSQWDVSGIERLLQPYSEVILCVEALHANRGLQIHIIELYLKELENVLTGEPTKQGSAATTTTTLSSAALSALLEPFINSLTIASPDDSVALRIVKHVLTPLAQSATDEDVQYPAIAAAIRSNRSALVARLDEAVSVAGISTARRDAMLHARDQLMMAEEAETEQTIKQTAIVPADELDVEAEDAAAEHEEEHVAASTEHVKPTKNTRTSAAKPKKSAKQTPSKPIDIVPPQKKRRQRVAQAA